MNNTERYKLIAQKEITKFTHSIPAHTGTTASIVHQLDVAIKVIAQLDQALLKHAAEFIEQFRPTEAETELIYEINAASLAALMARTNIPVLV